MNRSTLYSIEPIGIGSHKVESLTSYIGRIAAAHSVTTGNLLNKVINTLLKKDYIDKVAHRGGDGFYKSTNAINGNGSLAREFVDVMEELTGRGDLINTTLSMFIDVLPMRHLMKSFKAWCPYCLNDMRNTGIVYEPLIWSIVLKTNCNEHRTALVNKCPSCSKQQWNLARSYVPGYCNNCSTWLGSHNSGTENEANSECGRVIKELLESCHSKSKKHYKAETIIHSIKHIINTLFDGNVSIAARGLGFSKSTFYGWYTGKNRPPLNSIVLICVRLDINIADILEGNVMKKSSDIQKKISNKNSYMIKDRKTLNYNFIKIKLDEVIKGKKVVSLKQVASELDCDRRLLSRKFPVECSIIKRKNLKKLNANREYRKKHLIALVDGAIKEAINQNKYPSARTIEESIGIGSLREREIKEAFIKLKGIN